MKKIIVNLRTLILSHESTIKLFLKPIVKDTNI